MRSENYSFISIRLFHMEYKVDFELEILLSRYLIIIGNSLKSTWKFPSIHYMRIYDCTYSFFLFQVRILKYSFVYFLAMIQGNE